MCANRRELFQRYIGFGERPGISERRTGPFMRFFISAGSCVDLKNSMNGILLWLTTLHVSSWGGY